MAPRTTRETRALRRSSRLGSSNGSDESIKPTVQLSSRRTTGQLRLPIPTAPAAPAAKRGVKKRTTAGRRSKSKRSTNSSARNSSQSDECSDLGNHAVCREIPSAETANVATNDCVYCGPRSQYARCSHNRGQPLTESNGSFLGPNIVLPSVETDNKHGNVVKEGRPISYEEQRDVEDIINSLAKRRGQDQFARTASKPFMNILPKPAPSVNFHNDATVKKEPTALPPSCMRQLSQHPIRQMDNRRALQSPQAPHVRFANTFADSYASRSIDNTTDKDTEKWKKKLGLCEPLQIPQFRPPTPYPEVDMISPFSVSPHNPTPLSSPDLCRQAYFPKKCMVPTMSGEFPTSEQQHPTPTGLDTAQAYQSKDWPASFGRNSMASLPPAESSMPWCAPDTRSITHGYPTRLLNGHSWTEDNGRGKPSNNSEIYMQPPTPILRARQLPDYVKIPPHTSFM